MGAEEVSGLERPLPQTTEVPVRERLRWEKELLGPLPLGAPDRRDRRRRSPTTRPPTSGDLKDESLDGQRVVMVGIVTGFRRVITKANATMGVATIEDLQGSIEVVVFPKMYEQTAATWTEGAILAVAGRVDHRGEDVSLLADLATEWDAAVAKGPEAFAREVAAGDRGRAPRRQPVAVGPGVAAPVNGNGSGAGNGNGMSGNGHAAGPAASPAPRDPVRLAAPRRVPPGSAIAERPRFCRGRHGRPAVCRAGLGPRRSLRPSRADPDLSGAARPRAPRTRRRHRAGAARRGPRPGRRGRPCPDAAARPITNRNSPRDVRERRRHGPRRRRDGGVQGPARERPGSTRVVLHVPAPSGGPSLPMELRRGVAYDAELLAEVRRRLGEGIVELSLS